MIERVAAFAIQAWTERLRNIARLDHKEHRQYDGYFDKWVLAQADTKKVLKYKGGSRLSDGRWVLAAPDLHNWYDPDNGHICAVLSGVLRPV